MDIPNWLKPATVVAARSGVMSDSGFTYAFEGEAEANYNASVYNGGRYDIHIECFCWLGTYPGRGGQRYLANIFNNRTVQAGEVDTGTFSGYEDFWALGGKVGPVWYELEVTQLYYDRSGDAVIWPVIPYDFLITRQLPSGGGDPGPSGEGCPPDPLWPYPTLTATAPQSNTGGIISHRRVLGGNRKQDIT